MSYSHRHITTRVVDRRTNSNWLFTGVYKESNFGKHHITWDLLQALKPRDNTPWLVIGDFNEILYSSKKFKGRPRSDKQMQLFRETLVNCNLIDLGHRGDFFT